MSPTDTEEQYDSEGFAAVGDSDDELPNNFKLAEEMREQVELFLNMQKTAVNFQYYFQFEFWDSIQCYLMNRDLPFDNPDVMAINTSLSCLIWPAEYHGFGI